MDLIYYYQEKMTSLDIEIDYVLEQIKAEKGKLMKDKKIEKEKPLS